MSDNIPIELQVEIMKRLPVKSVLQFRSVSKGWKSLIDAPDFIASYTGQHQHLLLIYYHQHSSLNNNNLRIEQKYVSFVDDDTFPEHKVPLTLPPSMRNFCFSPVGTSHGLICLLYDAHPKASAVIWNPSIRKTVAVRVPNYMKTPIYITDLGFGVCRHTADPKIVKINQRLRRTGMETVRFEQVEVFTLSTRAWRSIPSNLPRKSIYLSSWDLVVLDGVIYWLATDYVTTDGGLRKHNLIVSFDFTSEEFGEVILPDSLAHRCVSDLSVSKLRESLVVVENGGVEADYTVFRVWMMMEDGGSRSFTKQFTFNVNTPAESKLYVRVFRKTGEPIIDIDHDVTGLSLAAYQLMNPTQISSMRLCTRVLCIPMWKHYFCFNVFWKRKRSHASKLRGEHNSSLKMQLRTMIQGIVTCNHFYWNGDLVEDMI